MKTVLIITDNLANQINGVVTTYKNIEACAIRDGFRFVYITPNEFRYFDCPIYNEVKIAYPRKMGEKIEKICPDHIHIATEGPVGLWARAYLTKHGYRYNTAYHTKFPEGLKTLAGIPESLTWLYIKWFHRHTGKVLSTTQSMVDQLKEKKLIADIVPWTRGVDRAIFNSSYRNKKDKVIDLLCVSRVSKEKNLEDFFELKYSNARKTMVGDGPMLEIYKKNYPDVNFVGFKVGKDLAEYFANADVFVFPSKWETFGIVMIEAMACGTPVAAYPTQGPIDVIDEEFTGYMSIDLTFAIDKCLMLNRKIVEEKSFRWSWDEAWSIFKNNLVSIK